MRTPVSNGGDAISSPCQLICTLDLETGFCFGCGRTRAEIARWTRLTEAERLSIMADLPARMRAFED